MSEYKNIGLLFYKHYFDDVDFKHYNTKNEQDDADNKNERLVEEKNNVILNSVLANSNYELPGNKTFELSTVYPGLFTGSGYPHESNIEGELKLGFFFDYTTGLPVIPGSSVKGVLRSAFDKADGDYVKELLKELKITGVKNIDIEKLKNNIFEGDEKTSVYQKDKFFNAFPVESNNEGGRFLGDDFITPHKEPLKDPKPLRFLKVLPEVTFRFNFQLHDFKDDNGKVILSADNKLELFKQILLDLGAGAKTNVGYGQFKDDQSTSEIAVRQNNSEARQHDIDLILKKIEEKEADKTEEDKRIVKDAKLTCQVIEINKKVTTFQFNWGRKLTFSKKTSKIKGDIEVGDIVEITVLEDYFIKKEVLFTNTINKANQEEQ